MAEVINGTAGNDRLTAVSDALIKAGAGDDTINVDGAQNVTIETGSGKDEIIFPFEGYYNPKVIFTDFDPQNDVLNFPEWAFFHKNYYFRAAVQDGNLVLKDGLEWYTLTFQGVTSTDEIKDTFVKKWEGYNGNLGGILYNTISGSSSGGSGTNSSGISITNSSSDTVIYGTPYNDTLENSARNVRLEALSGNDFITNKKDGRSVTINGGDGSDTIRSWGVSTLSIDGGNGDDYISNTDGGSSTINGGNGNDEILNSGNAVIISGGNGNDSIENVAQRKVTVIGGKGDDFIVNGIFDEDGAYYDDGRNVLFSYNVGDGNDTIWGFNSTSTLSISGSSYSTTKSGDDTVVRVGNGSITFKDSYPPNIIFTQKEDTTLPNSETPDNSPATISVSSYDANTKTWTIYDNYGDEAIAAEYNAEVKNIIAVGRTKSIKIIGNELDNLISGGNAGDELFGEKGADIIHGNGGNDTLHGGGGNDILYGDQGNDELHGDSGNDELYGGDGEDILFGTDGNNTLNGGKDSDTFVGGKGEDIFVHGSGDGNDLILEYSFEQGDKLKFEGELIEDVTIEGSDVIITTENGDKLTLKYAAGKEIAYINMRGNTETIDRNGNKPKSADSIYVKATRLMNSATNTVDSIKSSATKTLYDSASAEANFAVSSLKNSIRLYPPGNNIKISDIDDSVYEKISEDLLAAFDGSLVEGYEYNRSGTKLVQQIAKQISSGILPPTSYVVPADETKNKKFSYTVTNYIMAMDGVTNAFVQVAWSNKKTLLTWTNLNQESGQTGLANYLKSLSDLNKEVWKDFVAAWLSPVTGKNTRAALDFAEKVIEALCYEDDTKAKALLAEIGEDYRDKLADEFNDWFTKKSDDLLREFITKYIPKGSDILDAIDKIKAAASAYDELKEHYESLIQAITDYKNLAESGNFLEAYDSFEKDYAALENLYGDFNDALNNQPTKAENFFDKINNVIGSLFNLASANAAEQALVTDTDSLDDLTANGTAILTFTENSGRGIQNADLRSSEYPQVVSLEGGNQNVQFNDKDGNVAIVGASASGSKEIVFGNGDDLGIFLSPKANINVSVGAGNDSVLVDNNAHVRVDMTNADSAMIIPYSGKVTLDSYDASTRSSVMLPDIDNIADALKDSSIQIDGDAIKLNSSTSIEVNDSSTDSTFVNLIGTDGRKTIFGWSPQSGGVVDGNSIDKPQVLYGDAPDGDSTIRGGIGNDTIIAGAKDVVSLSGGHDDLYIDDETSHGVTIDMGDGSAQSRTKVVEGFDVAKDALKIDSPENINARVLDDSLQFIKGDSRVTFDELATFDDANGLQVQVDGTTYELRSDYDGGLANADYLWTDTDGNYFLTDSTFRIFDDGSTREYFIGEGSGKLTIDGFEFGRDNDKLNLSSIDGLTTYGDNLYVTSGDSDIVEVTGGAGKTIDVKLDGTTYTAQLGKHLTYDLDAEYYGDLHGGTGCAISVGANFAQEEVAIYLNEEEEADGKVRYYGGVTKIDASVFTGRASLVGSEFNDKIIAAQGATSLWGGESGDDELFGTGSDNSFFYCKGDGDDKIYNAANGDSVNLVDITLEDITNSIISDGAVTLELSDGGRLTVMNSADVTFNLGDGTSWKADRQAREWHQQA